MEKQLLPSMSVGKTTMHSTWKLQSITTLIDNYDLYYCHHFGFLSGFSCSYQDYAGKWIEDTPNEFPTPMTIVTNSIVGLDLA